MWQGGCANGNHFGFLLADRSRRPTWNNGFTGDDSSANITMMKDCTTKQTRPEEAPSAPRPTGQPDTPTWELIGPQGTASFSERTEPPLPPSRPRCIFIYEKMINIENMHDTRERRPRQTTQTGAHDKMTSEPWSAFMIRSHAVRHAQETPLSFDSRVDSFNSDRGSELRLDHKDQNNKGSLHKEARETPEARVRPTTSPQHHRR